MLTLVRFTNETVFIGDDIIVRVLDVCRKSGKVRLGFEAPRDIPVDREEVRISKNVQQKRERPGTRSIDDNL